jgi:hypothetical protein
LIEEIDEIFEIRKFPSSAIKEKEVLSFSIKESFEFSRIARKDRHCHCRSRVLQLKKRKF